MFRLSFLLSLLLMPSLLWAQQEDSLFSIDKTKIQIIHADDLFGEKKDEIYYNRLVGNVQVRNDEILMTCDSAYLNLDRSFIRAFGNVDIVRGGASSAKANYVEYNGITAQAVMKDNVQIYDDGNNLVTDDLTYNLKSKIGIYQNGGSLVTKETTVSSDYGKYNGRSKQAYFKGNVVLTNPDSEIESKELEYNTESKNIRFLDESTIYGKEAVIETKGGSYSENSGLAIFNQRTTVENEDQIITGNKINFNQKTNKGEASGNVIIKDKLKNTLLYTDAAKYDKASGYGEAKGNVHYLDQNEGTQLYAGQVYYNEYNDFLLALERPLLITVSENDSIFISADTMVNLRISDTAKLSQRKLVDKEKVYSLLVEKQEDFGDDRKLIVCNSNVKVFADSMQSICDSMSYAQSDSVFRLFKSPILWSGTQQAVGDTIYLFTKSNTIDKVLMRGNSLLSNDTKYPKMYDQIKGRNIDAFFLKGEINEVLVDGNAQSIYYTKDDAQKFVGMNTAEGSTIKINFIEKNIDKIAFYKEPKGVFYPMDKIPDSDRFLTGFVWQEKLRPQSKNDLRPKSVKPKKSKK